MLDQITPLILTFDEEPNIARVLDKLGWAKRILVIDSGSTDATLDILAAHPAVEVVHRAFDSFAGQCNSGLERVTTPFVLSMDADYVLSDALVAEIAGLAPDPAVDGYRTRFRYVVHGRRLSATLYPPRVTLYRPERARYEDFGHGHKLAIPGPVRDLAGTIDHDDRKPLSRWLASQQRYAVREIDYLLSAPRETLSRTDRLRLTGWPAPILVFFYTLLAKRCLFDGLPGWHYVLQRTYAEVLMCLELAERRLAARQAAPDSR